MLAPAAEGESSPPADARSRRERVQQRRDHHIHLDGLDTAAVVAHQAAAGIQPEQQLARTPVLAIQPEQGGLVQESA